MCFLYHIDLTSKVKTPIWRVLENTPDIYTYEFDCFFIYLYSHSMKQKIFLIIGIVVLSLFGISIFNEFMANHTYYNQMFTTGANRKLLLRAIISL